MLLITTSKATKNEAKEPINCKYLMDNRLCKSVTEEPEVRNEVCTNKPKNYCCYLCLKQEKCDISCQFLDSKESADDKNFTQQIDKEIEKYQNEIGRLSILLANGKIGEQSFSAATKTLESKINNLEKGKKNPNLLTVSNESTEFDETSNPIQKPTALWYLAPFFFGILGGIIGYVATHDDDRGMADVLFAFGIVWTILLAIGYWFIIAARF
jgi:hypothetical protein